MRRWRLNSGYNGATDQRRTQAGTIPMLKHYMERNLNLFLYSDGWTPANISTDLWLDAQDQESVVLASGVISQWNDKSGNNYDMVQANAADRPTYNGSTSILFDTTDYMSVAAQMPGTDDDFMFAIVIDADASVDSNPRYFGTVDSGKNIQFGYQSSDFYFTRAGNVTYTTPSSYTTEGTTNIVLHTASSSSYAIRINGSDGNAGANSQPPTANSLIANDTTMISAGYQPNTFKTTGDIFEIIYIGDSVSLSDQQKIEGYLAHKWGLTSNLPVDHPYKSVAP